jgi:hypothetical protein
MCSGQTIALTCPLFSSTNGIILGNDLYKWKSSIRCHCPHNLAERNDGIGGDLMKLDSKLVQYFNHEVVSRQGRPATKKALNTMTLSRGYGKVLT